MQNIIQAINNELSTIYSQAEIRTITNIILKKEFNLSPADILSYKFTNLYDKNIRKIQEIIFRLKKSEPIQYVIGETEFYNMKFEVNPSVLIPRPETEELVEWIITDNANKHPTILDIGTGSGCIAITLSKKLIGSKVHGWDISEQALTTATANAQLNNTTVVFSRRDILKGADENMLFNIIVSNPPYISEKEKAHMDINVLNHEPHVALFVPNEDPLIFYRHIAEFSLRCLTPGGILYFEINHSKGEQVLAMLREKGYKQTELRNDISGNPRMIKAVKPI